MSNDHFIAKENRSQETHFDNEEKLRYEVARTVTLSPELYEKLFISPKNDVSGSLRTTFANPTPVGVLGFSVAAFPLAASLMGWRDAGGLGAAALTSYLWFGGGLLFLAGVGEFLLANTFSMMFCFAYGAFFCTYGATFIPWFNAVGFYNPDGSGVGSPGAPNQTPVFLASYAFLLLGVSLLSFVFLIGSLRTNGVFAALFLSVTVGAALAAGAYFNLSKGNVSATNKLFKGAGGCFFVASMLGYYFFLALMVAIMELPFPDIPIFDLSTVVKPKSRASPKQD
ncbi:GPR1/FUN34/YaaH-class plasma membrane protein [Plenodomus tracheiphilus IPT5]|uniref:GPR1/FUN34/YaaH-class plasma membrane protein n=1 Tax=Plenodomus tracheiphilus IPT5 TaxID=1408161 RepID=A0A6A7BM00_9PLEO|nr:GPR1/FUN34/YaaH-class plasma membrane protein [Plenodomus tracheiphilus IPT5]